MNRHAVLSPLLLVLPVLPVLPLFAAIAVLGCDPSPGETSVDATVSAVTVGAEIEAEPMAEIEAEAEAEADPWPYPWPSPADPILLASQRLDEQLELLRALEPSEREQLQASARDLLARSLVHRTIVAFAFELHEGLGELVPEDPGDSMLTPADRDRLVALQEAVALQVEVLGALGYDPEDPVEEDEAAELDDATMTRLAPAFPYSAEMLVWRDEIIALEASGRLPCEDCSAATTEARAALAKKLGAMKERADEVPDLGC